MQALGQRAQLRIDSVQQRFSVVWILLQLQLYFFQRRLIEVAALVGGDRVVLPEVNDFYSLVDRRLWIFSACPLHLSCLVFFVLVLVLFFRLLLVLALLMRLVN